MSTIAAGTTSGTALVSTGNTDGTLQLQVNGTTPALTLNTSGAVGVGSTPGYGTSGQVLTSAGTGAAPTWTTPAAGALTFISSATASSSASIAFTGISSTYDVYMLELVRVIPATDATSLRLRFSTDNGSTYISTAAYGYGSYKASFAGGASSGAGGNNFSATFIALDGNSTGVSNTTVNGGWSGFVYLYKPSSSSSYTTITYQAGVWDTTAATYASVTGMGAYGVGIAVNAIQFSFSSGNIASGAIRLYGIANS